MVILKNGAEFSAGGQARAVVLLVVLLGGLLGGVLITRWLVRPSGAPGAPVSAETGGGLSDSTKAVLEGMKGSIDVHYYSVLDLPEVLDETKEFAGRVDEMVSAYEGQSAGKLKVVRHTRRAEAAEAAKHGLRPIAAEDRDAAYLGIVLTRGDRKQVLPQLLPAWEGAVEADLTRAIQNLAEGPDKEAPEQAVSDAEAIAEAKQLVPDLEGKSLEEGKKLLKDAALSEFKEAAQQGQVQLKEAQDRVLQAQSNGSEEEQQEALQNLQRVQAEQTERLQDIAARSDARVAAFERMKKR